MQSKDSVRARAPVANVLLGAQLAGATDVVVLISGATAALVRDHLPLTDAGSFEIKGRAEPIEVFRLLP